MANILFSNQKRKLVPFDFISHSKLYNTEKVLWNIKIKLKEVHDLECMWLCLPSLVHFEYF